MGLWEGLMRGSKALLEGADPACYEAGGLKVSCPHCRSDGFHEARALRNTAGMTLMGLDWADKRATTLTCGRCGLIQWFAIPPRPIPAKPQKPENWLDD